MIDGVPVSITNLPRTVADCLKYRNKIGLDVALEALKANGVLGEHRALWCYTQFNRVANLMQPNPESLA